MSAKQYLDAAGVERLIRNINLQLSHKVSVEDNENILSNYATNSALAQVEAKIAGIYHFKGSVATYEALEEILNPEVGDVYNILENGMNVAWTGEEWDEFGSIGDLTEYAKLEDIDSIPDSVLTSILFGGPIGVVSNVSEMVAMIANSEPEVEIVLDDNLILASSLVVPEGKVVTLDLGGNTLSSGNIIPISVDGGEVVLKNGTVQTRTTGVLVDNGGSITVDGANIESTGHNGISLFGGSSGVINSGSITSQEAGVAVFKNSDLVINGGIITGIDNGPIMGNGTVGDEPNNGENINIVMNGGKLIAHIQTAGYTACAVYLPNTGKFTMNGGEIISDGAGLVMRAGEVELNGGSITANGAPGFTGKVGDSRIVVGPYAVVYDELAKYPGATAGTFKLSIGRNMQLSGTDGDISTLLSDGVSANIIDNRA